MKPLTEEWVRKAEEDYRVAKREIEAEPPSFNAVCFHAQQCVEKYLKAVLQENEVAFQKVHDLAILLDQCRSFVPELEGLREDLQKLNVFAVEVRYPGFEAQRRDAEEALSAMEKASMAIRPYFEKLG